MIKAEHITKTYGKQKALDDVTFTIGKGEIAGFLGPNGAGKSTMMKILTGYLPFDSGKAEIADIRVSVDSVSSRHKVGYLPENNPLYTDMYVKEYLIFVGGFYRISNLKERVEELIRLTGLTPECHKRIEALSKGYRQRVGLAQALLPDPEVLILDEPTTGLDPNQISEVRDLIKALGKEKTVMLSTHIMQEVQAICERAIIINKGKIVADAPVAELGKAETSDVKIKVEFDQSVPLNELQTIDGIKDIIQDKLYITVTAEKDIRKAIAKKASENNWLILSMNIEEVSLEDIFKHLTR